MDDNLTYHERTNITEDVGIQGPHKVLSVLNMYYTPLLVALGIVGNYLIVLVFLKTNLSKLSLSYYLSALAISNSVFLISVFVSWLDVMINVPVFKIPIICQNSVYLYQTCSFLNVWFVVASIVDRFIAVSYPKWKIPMKLAKAVLTVLTLFGLILYSPFLLISASQTQIQPISNATVEVCTVAKRWMNVAEILNYMNLMVTLLLPFSLIVVLNTLIITTMRKSARTRHSIMLKIKRKKPQPLFGKDQRPTLASVLSQTSSSDTKVTEMQVTVVYTQPIGNDIIIFQDYFNLLFTTNFAINFALYCVCGQIFRSALISLFCPRYRIWQDNTHLTVFCEHSGSPGLVPRYRTQRRY